MSVAFFGGHRPPLQLALQDNRCDRVLLAVAQGNERVCDAALFGEFFGAPGEDEKRFATWFLVHVDVAPPHRFADTGAECFRNGFLGGEPRGQMSRGKFHRHRVFDFATGKDAMEKFLAEAVERTFNARTLDKVDTNPEHAHPLYSSMARSISRTALSSPTKTAREIIEWPMLS